MAPHTYGEILARNVRAARSRAGIGQASVAARMRALGFTQWVPQTVSKSERNDRRLLAEELLGLAWALETSMAALLQPTRDDKQVELPSGDAVSADSVIRSVQRGINDGSVNWAGDVLARIGEPGYPPGIRPEFDAWPSGEH